MTREEYVDICAKIDHAARFSAAPVRQWLRLLEACDYEQREKIRSLEDALEQHVWRISPAMAEAKIDELNRRIDELLNIEFAYSELMENAVKFAMACMEHTALHTEARAFLASHEVQAWRKEQS